MPDSGESKVAKCGRWIAEQNHRGDWCVHHEGSEMIVHIYLTEQRARAQADSMNAAESAMRERRLAGGEIASE